MRFIPFLFFGLLLPFKSHSQDTTVIKHQANLIAQATFKGDVQTILAYTYPALITLSGGPEQMQQLITDRITRLKNQGIKSFSGSVGAPGRFFIAGDEIHCLIPEDIYLSTSAGRYKSRSYLLGISNDKGKSWKFLDVGNMPADILHRLLPDFNNDLVIPPPAKPEFLAN